MVTTSQTDQKHILEDQITNISYLYGCQLFDIIGRQLLCQNTILNYKIDIICAMNLVVRIYVENRITLFITIQI